MNSTICTFCKVSKAKYEDIHKGQEKALCCECMEQLQLAWDGDNYEFVDQYRQCTFCGGTEEWCTACQTYSCHDCDPYGTCQCS